VNDAFQGHGLTERLVPPPGYDSDRSPSANPECPRPDV
jgi:hypothetical protein